MVLVDIPVSFDKKVDDRGVLGFSLATFNMSCNVGKPPQLHFLGSHCILLELGSYLDPYTS